MRTKRTALKRLLAEANLSLPRRAGRIILRDEKAPWDLHDENFRLVAGLDRYRTLATVHGQTGDGKEVSLFDLQARGRAWSCVMIQGVDLPDFFVAAPDHELAVVEHAPADEVTTGDGAFDRHFAVWAEDEAVVADLLTPKAVHHIQEAGHDLAVEVKNGYLLCSSHPLDPEEHAHAYRHVARLVRLLESARQPLAA